MICFRTPMHDASNRLDNYISSQVVLATIIADRNKITGLTIGSLSDYIAVLTLTQARMSEGCSQSPSIMDLMAADVPMTSGRIKSPPVI